MKPPMVMQRRAYHFRSRIRPALFTRTLSIGAVVNDDNTGGPRSDLLPSGLNLAFRNSPMICLFCFLDMNLRGQ